MSNAKFFLESDAIPVGGKLNPVVPARDFEARKSRLFARLEPALLKRAVPPRVNL
jgi:hypothetical protein